MGNRLDLQTILEGILGSRNVYFQPPTSVTMHYPAIVYSINKIENSFANNGVYIQTRSYQVTVIDKNPDSILSETISKLPGVQFSRQFTSENLYHYVYILNY